MYSGEKILVLLFFLVFLSYLIESLFRVDCLKNSKTLPLKPSKTPRNHSIKKAMINSSNISKIQKNISQSPPYKNLPNK
jgi:hypothetical protein